MKRLTEKRDLFFKEGKKIKWKRWKQKLDIQLWYDTKRIFHLTLIELNTTTVGEIQHWFSLKSQALSLLTELVNPTFHLFKPVSLSQIQTLRGTVYCIFFETLLRLPFNWMSFTGMMASWLLFCESIRNNNTHQSGVVYSDLLSIWMLLLTQNI